MSSPFLYFAGDRLSGAELSAARLDGDVVELGEGYIPADAVETAALRAGSLSTLLGRTLAATHVSAAWIHGALPEPPARHTVQRAVARRIHHVRGRRVLYRDLTIDEDDRRRLGGVWVTTLVRTLADLARVDDETHMRAARLMAAMHPGLPAAARERLRDAGPLPRKRAAIVWLDALSRGCQDDVTR